MDAHNSSQKRPIETRRSPKPIQVEFGILGFFAGIGAAVYAYNQSSSWWLAFFAFVMSSYLIGRGLADVLTEPRKIERAIYFTLLPAASTALLYGADQAWDRTWLAVVIGLVFGGMVHQFIGRALFPDIAAEEATQDRQNLPEAGHDDSDDRQPPAVRPRRLLRRDRDAATIH